MFGSGGFIILISFHTIKKDVTTRIASVIKVNAVPPILLVFSKATSMDV